jgi:hypothetical protein
MGVERMNYPFRIFTSSIPIIIGVCGILYSVYRLFIIKISKGWPYTIGKIVTSHIETYYHGERCIERAVIEYEYEVGGKLFRGSKISSGVDFGISSSAPSLSPAEYVVKKYGRGDEVRVFYNPNRPKSSFLEKGGYIGLAMSIIFSVVSISFGIIWYKYS